MKSDVTAILVGDLHLRHTVPVARGERNWYTVMSKFFEELQRLCNAHDHCPIIYPGDVFDRWNSPPELINFAIEHLPHGISIPGQHDLPLHRLEDVKKSAYWTLVKAGTLHDISKQVWTPAGSQIVFHGFPWGVAPRPPIPYYREQYPHYRHVAVVHHYLYLDESNAHPGADPQDRIDRYGKACLSGFDAAVTGDNHKFWMFNAKGLRVYNGGTVFAIKSDERAVMPKVGLLLRSGKVRVHNFLDLPEPKWADPSEADAESVGLDAKEVIEALLSLGDSALDFCERLRRRVSAKGVPDKVRDLILKLLDEHGNQE